MNACKETPLFEKKIDIDISENLGEVTVKILEKSGIDYVGSAGGMNSINNTPTGLDALEVLSDVELRAFGWCYSVNGQVISEYTDKYYLKQNDEVKWFFAFAHYYKGKWLTMCTPARTLASSSLCN